MIGFGVSIAKNRNDKKGRYFASIWSGLPGDVCNAFIVRTTLELSV